MKSPQPIKGAAGEIVETGITWEHDTGNIVISTRSQKIANRLKSLGLAPDYNESDDYLTFRSSEADLRITITRRKSATEAQLASAARGRAAMKRASSSGSPGLEGSRTPRQTKPRENLSAVKTAR